jgi:hypothetical protein
MAIQGSRYEEITDDLKERFLDLVAQGYTRPEAAKALGANPRQLRACCSPHSHRYDEKFAKAYAKITEPEGEHHAGLVERLRAAGIERALRSSDSLLMKYSVIYDPDWEVHKPQSMQINFNIDQLRAEFEGLKDNQLEAYIEKKKAELEAGDIIDAEEEDAA